MIRYTFDCPVFAETLPDLELTRNGTSYKKNGREQPENFTRTRKKGRPKLSWLNSHRINADSESIDWLVAVMLICGPKESGSPNSIFSDWTSWINAKGILSNCGHFGGSYPTWISYTIAEIRQFIGNFILNSIGISPRMSYMFSSQEEDSFNGNYLCHLAFGDNAEKMFKQFRSLFAIQDPMVPIPPGKEPPEHKVDPFLLYMLRSMEECWDTGPNIAGDEQDVCFKERHPAKARVTFKKDGDGF